VDNNDILRRIRYALDISDDQMIGIFGLAHAIDQSSLTALLRKEGEDGFVACSRKVLELFLDGLILHKRGRKVDAHVRHATYSPALTNNVILKKLRIALELKEDDMISTLKLAGLDISRAELSALFRKEGHRNYKACGDQILRKFLAGLSTRYRKQH